MTSTWISWQELAGAIGADNADAFCRVYGGLSIYIPKTALEASNLLRILSHNALEALSRAFGGLMITVPNRRRADPLKPRVIRMLEEGQTAREIAEKLGVTQRYVEIVRRTLKGASRQYRLFDE